MAFGVTQKSNKKAYIGIKIKQADGSVVDLGTISSRPLLGRLQRLMVTIKILMYRRRRKNKNV